MKAYKGFDKDLKCRDFQFEVGKEYTEEKAEMCKCGFHACLYPLDCFSYYPPANSRYCLVEINDIVESKTQDDTKVCGKNIQILKELSLTELTLAAVDYVLDKNDKKMIKSSTGNRASSSSTGNRASSSSTGNRASSSSTGDMASSSSTGDRASSSSTGYMASSSSTGDMASSSSTGDRASSSSTGYMASSSSTGNRASSSSTGDMASSSSTGDMASSSSTGDRASSSSTGSRASSSSTGDMASSSSTGDMASSSSTGNRASSSVSGIGSVAISIGYQSRAKACLGSAICVVERGAWNGKTFPLIGIKSAIVDGETLKADTFYTLKGGEFVEVEDD
ncbi:hypothetical protein [Ruminococcus sp.]|uniref:DUF7666 domain-containing protein n=1 Tax=Ruminococcus sp. TaxID=41978 RepID=UPI00388F997D